MEGRDQMCKYNSDTTVEWAHNLELVSLQNELMRPQEMGTGICYLL